MTRYGITTYRVDCLGGDDDGNGSCLCRESLADKRGFGEIQGFAGNDAWWIVVTLIVFGGVSPWIFFAASNGK